MHTSDFRQWMNDWDEWLNHAIIQSIDSTINQSIHRSINQSINQQSINQSINQSIKQASKQASKQSKQAKQASKQASKRILWWTMIWEILDHWSCSRLPQRNASLDTRKSPKISSGAYIFQILFSRGLFLQVLIFRGAYLRRENLRFKIDWASLIVAFFYSVFEGNFSSTSSRGFFALPLWGPYTWRAYVSNFTVFDYE